MRKMASIYDVARYILDSVGGEISSMKLQKLCYYAQAWNLVWEGTPLFKEDFLRWDNGPVCRELFELHQGRFFVDSSTVRDELLSDPGVSEKESFNVIQIIEDYGKYNGAQLSELTHSEDPWKLTKKDKIISKDLMKSYYSSLTRKDKLLH
jgi:uncharacterized phage-associated protein